MTTRKQPTDLELELDRYFEAAKTTRSVRRGVGLKDWALYTAAAGSALVAGQSAEAAIVYSGAQNIMLTVAGQSGVLYQPVNFDGAGGDDVTLALFWNTAISGGAAAILSQDFFVSNNTGGALRMGVSSYVSGNAGSNLGYNVGVLRDVIGGSLLYGTWPGGHPTSTTGFAGVAFYDTGSNLHFGWLRLRLRNDANGVPDKLTLVDWAYESVAGDPIHVGDVPEPSGLALLAAGAAGVAAFRKRRRSA